MLIVLSHNSGYEDLVGSYREMALRVLRYAGVPLPEYIDWAERRMQRQSDEINEEWIRRYHELREHQDTEAESVPEGDEENRASRFRATAR